MGVTVGEVNTVLTAQDGMSPAIAAASARVQQLTERLAALGAEGGESAAILSTQLKQATAALNALTASARLTASAQEEVEEKTERAGQSMNRFGSYTARVISGLAIYYAARGAFDFTVDLYRDAEAMVAFSRTSGIAVDTLSKLSSVADITGQSFTTVETAIAHMNQRLGEEKSATLDALVSIGLSFRDLQHQSPEQQFQTIVKALVAIPDPAQRAAAELALFGRSAEIDPIIKQYDRMKDQISAMPDETARSLAEAADHWRTFWSTVKVGAADAFNFAIDATAKIAEPAFMPPQNKAEEQASQLPTSVSMIGLTYALKSTPQPKKGDINLSDEDLDATEKAMRQLNMTGQDYIDKLEKEATGTKALTGVQIEQLDKLRELNQLTADNAAKLTYQGESIGVTSTQFAEYKKHVEDTEGAYKKMTAAITEVESAGTTWQQTLQGIDKELVQSVQAGLKGGASQQALAEYYGLTATQVRAVASALKEQQLAAERTQQMMDQYYSLSAKHGQSSYEQQRAAIESWYNDQLAKAQKAGIVDEGFYTSLAKVANEKLTDISADWDKLDKSSKNTLQDQVTIADNNLNYVLTHTDKFTDKEIQSYHDADDAAHNALNNIGGAVVTVVGKTTSAAESAANAVNNAVKDASDTAHKSLNRVGDDLDNLTHKASNSIADLAGQYSAVANRLSGLTGDQIAQMGGRLAYDDYGNPYMYVPGVNQAPTHGAGPGVLIPHYASGTDFHPGGTAMVGEHGPELVNLPRGSQVLPHGMGSGSGVSVTIVVQGSLISSRQELSKVVDAALVHRLKSIGYRFPVGVQGS